MSGRELGVATRLGLFGAGLAVVFVAAFGVGRAVGPEDEAPAPTPSPTTTTEPPAAHDGDHLGTGS